MSKTARQAERVSAADELNRPESPDSCPECGMRGWHKLDCSQRDHERVELPATRDMRATTGHSERPGAASRARLEATPEGRALLAAAKAHLLECVQLTPLGVDAFAPLLAISMESRPCRCGPDGCADSVACPRGVA